MSFFNSLNQMWIKIQQKNIVLVSGNVDEVIPVSLESYKKISNNYSQSKGVGFISLIEYLSQKCNTFENLRVFSNFSPINGNVIATENIVENKNNDSDYSDDFLSNDSETSCSIEEYINWLNMQIKTLHDDSKSGSAMFVINFSDILFNDRTSNVNMLKLSQLIESFIEFRKILVNKFINNNYKLVIICRNPNVLNSLITNNVEFGSVNISKPNKNEREEFFSTYSNRFENIKSTISDNDHHDFKEAVTISDGLSFREIFQLSKLKTEEIIEKQPTFAELYKLATFFKKESEWEKIDTSKMSNIDGILSKRVKGQDEAINKVKQTLIRSFVGMNGILHSLNNNKPKGVLFFAGPTGTGKTELAKSISEFIFGDENRIIRFDMSEFNHEHSDQRLIGAPPGYVGYDAGGELTNKVKENPFSILLFDEIEKANGKILDKFLQILEDGRLTSSQGEIIDFSQTFIIFTSNIGAKTATIEKEYSSLEKYFLTAVKKYFKEDLNRPEILNRIGEKNIVAFNFITDLKIINEIIISKIEKSKSNLLKEKYIDLIYDKKFIDDISDILASNFNKEYGGRGIITELETIFIDPLSNFIFQNYTKWINLKNENKIMQIKLSIINNKVKYDLC